MATDIIIVVGVVIDLRQNTANNSFDNHVQYGGENGTC